MSLDNFMSEKSPSLTQPWSVDSVVGLRIGHLFLAPSLVNAFVKHPATPNFDLKFLSTAMIATAPLDPEVKTGQDCAAPRLRRATFAVDGGCHPASVSHIFSLRFFWINLLQCGVYGSERSQLY
ncbi:hypothetical protein B0H14DRAFT_2589443 [Mycena olivaceomarginata]|nr:hypothetical protein B0H14DRAFT_2589443 [Mycena olivaceomarginata]